MLRLLVCASLCLSTISQADAAAIVVSPVVSVAAVAYPVPSAVPAGASTIDPTPVGASFEFFMWPSYMTNITPPVQCLKQFDRVYGQKMPVRVGGTTQDRAMFDPNFNGYVSYHVDNPLDAPMSLTYGPKFFDLIGQLGAPTTLGLNRGGNNRSNTYAAVKVAKAKVQNYLTAIELGNEPDFWFYITGQRPAPWTQVEEGAEQADWAQGLIDIWKSPLPILSPGVYGVPYPVTPTWPTTQYLISTAFNATIKAATKFYCNHLYRQGAGTTLPNEMNHASTVSSLVPIKASVDAAASVGKRHVLGETNFHADDTTQDRTFGSALQTLDKILSAMVTGVQRLYFHQGTINQAYFNWWSDNQINVPFYGGFFAALALADGDNIVASDPGTDSYAQYVIYKRGKPFKAVLINTDYYSGSGARNSSTFTLTGLCGSDSLKSLRFTAPSSEFYAGPEQTNPALGPTIGGQYFSNDNCAIHGNQNYETTQQSRGNATFILKASEALLVFL